VVSYSHFSGEKQQIMATTFQDTIDILYNLKKRGDFTNDEINMIIFITNSCAGQYKSGTALYLLTS
jgi:hypothetical protein